MPKFVTNQTTPFDDGSLAPKTNTGTTSTITTNTGATTTTNNFVPTVDSVYTQKEYFNPETGETRIINFYNNKPINKIPEGFVLKEDYVEDETTTTDLESTSVQSTQVRDDDSKTKARLEKMVRDQGGQTQLNKLREALEKNEEGSEQAIKDAYLDNERFKSLLTMGTGIIPALGIGRLGAGYQGKQLEKLMKENNIEIPKLEEGFFERVKGAFADIFKGEGRERIDYDPSKSPISRIPDAKNFLSDADQRVYNHAVRTGNASVARHHEIVNNKMNKLSLYMQGKPVTGLSDYDIRQAEYLFNSEGEREYQTVNEAIEAGKVREKPGTGKKDDKDDKDKKDDKPSTVSSAPTQEEKDSYKEALSSLKEGSDEYQQI
jgi:hypothetical protein